MSSFNQNELRYFWGVSAEFRQLVRGNGPRDQMYSCAEELRGIQLHTKQSTVRKQCGELLEEFEVWASPLAQLPAQQIR
jgi:hypothetical protein